MHFALNDSLERLPIRAPKFRSLAEAAQAIRRLEGAPEVDPEQLKRERERQEQEKELIENILEDRRKGSLHPMAKP